MDSAGLGARYTLLAPTLLGKMPGFWSRKHCFPELAAVAQARGPAVAPYTRLCDVYHDYAVNRLPDYCGFLNKLATRWQLPMRSVLDLACGSGTTSARLAVHFAEVDGLDASQAMLDQAARRCANLPRVRFTRGDFKAFQLGRRFDAVVCASNSLNYVSNPEDLASVFQGVAEHLEPGGLFTFDVVTTRGMRLLNGVVLHFDANGQRCAYAFHFDAETQREQVEVVFRDAIEFHQRVPIDVNDVRRAATAHGLVVRDFFASMLLPGKWCGGAICYFVLQRPR